LITFVPYFSKKKDFILIVGEDEIGHSNQIGIYDICLNLICKIYGAHSDAIKRIRPIKNSPSLIGSCSRDFTVKIWNISNLSSTAIQTFTGHTDEVNDLASFKYADGNMRDILIASASNDRTIQIWSIATGLKMNEIKFTNGPVFVCLLLIEEFDLLASGDSHNQIKLFNIGRNFTLNSTLLGHKKTVLELVLINETTLVSSSQDTTIIIWDLIRLSILTTLYGHTNSVNGLSLISENLLISGANDNTIRVWDLVNQILLKNISTGDTGIVALKNENYFFIGGSGVNSGIKKMNVLTGQKLLNVNVRMRVGTMLLLENNSSTCKLIIRELFALPCSSTVASF
jgi:WD40 repeat protein